MYIYIYIYRVVYGCLWHLLCHPNMITITTITIPIVSYSAVLSICTIIVIVSLLYKQLDRHHVSIIIMVMTSIIARINSRMYTYMYVGKQRNAMHFNVNEI